MSKGNVLVTAKYKARLCDFGLALLHGDNGFQALETSTGHKSSIRWSSPELLDKGLRSPAADVYAWAWLVWEVRTLRFLVFALKGHMDPFADYDRGSATQRGEQRDGRYGRHCQ